MPLFPMPPARDEAKDIFADAPDGLPTRPLFGNPWLLHGGSVGASARPQVVSGKLTEPVAFPAAGYAQLELDDSVLRIWARFTLSAYTTNNGSAVLAAWDADVNTTWPTVPDSPAHLTVNGTTAVFGVWSGGSFTQVKDWTFGTALTADGATVHSAEVVIDKANSTAYVTLPDGITRVVTHATIGSVSAPYAVWEIFGLATTDTKAAFTDVGAESTAPESVLAAKVRSVIPTDPTIVVQYAPGSDLSVAVPASATDVDAVNLVCEIVGPASGKVLMELEGFLAMTGSTRVLWAVKSGATTYGTKSVVDQQFNGTVGYRHLITGLTPGSLYSFVWRHLALAAATATLKLDNPNGYWATMKATPIP